MYDTVGMLAVVDGHDYAIDVVVVMMLYAVCWISVE